MLISFHRFKSATLHRGRTSLATFLLGLLPLAMVSCATDHSRDASLYRDLLDQTPPPNQTPATAPPQDTPLLLSDALALVNLNNEQLAIEGEEYVQAVIDKKRSASRFLPTLGFFPAYVRSEGLSGRRRASNDDDRDRLELPLGLSWNLFNGGRDFADYYRATAEIAQREALLMDLQASLMLDVVSAFYLTLRAERSIAVLESSLRVQEERVRDITARRDAGIARPLDVAQTEAVASEARVSLITARQDAYNARQALELLLDVPVGQRPLEDNLPAHHEAETTLDSWHAQALEHRQDLQAASYAVTAARHVVDDAFGQYYPSVTLNLEYLLAFNPVESESGWTAVLRANLPIFSAGRIEADVRTAWSQVRQAVLGERYTRRLIHQQVAQAHGDLLASEQRLGELHRKLDAASIAYDQADSSYNVGLATNLERLDAQDRLLLTELEIANEEFFLREAYLRLLRSAGQLNGNVIQTAMAAYSPMLDAPAPTSTDAAASPSPIDQTPSPSR